MFIRLLNTFPLLKICYKCVLNACRPYEILHFIEIIVHVKRVTMHVHISLNIKLMRSYHLT